MTHEEVSEWLCRVLSACIGLLLFVMVVIVLGLTAGYATEKYAQYKRDVKCINSACDQPCKTGARFVRHQGCVK